MFIVELWDSDSLLDDYIGSGKITFYGQSDIDFKGAVDLVDKKGSAIEATVNVAIKEAALMNGSANMSSM